MNNLIIYGQTKGTRRRDSNVKCATNSISENSKADYTNMKTSQLCWKKWKQIISKYVLPAHNMEITLCDSLSKTSCMPQLKRC